MNLIKAAVLCMLLCNTVQAQFTDDFSDGDFTNHPAWLANSADWIVNSNGQLQSNNSNANSTFSIVTPSSIATEATWKMYVQLDFNTSSTNYADVFLTASDPDLTASSTSGYFVRIGNTTDEISLYKKTGTVSTKFIDGVDGTTNSSHSTITIKVTRNAANEWRLYRDISGGSSFVLEGAATDSSFGSSAFFGILVKQSTAASFAQKHFFDDISIQPYTADITAPVIRMATATSVNTLDVLFDESLDYISSRVAANYSVNNNIGNAVTAVQDSMNTALVHLIFVPPFQNGSSNMLTVNGVQDLDGNAVNNGQASFVFYVPQQFDMVMDEIMADPTPQVGLPNAEWVELKNTAAFPINIQGWKFCDGSGCSLAMPRLILEPDSLLILCSSSNAAVLSTFGRTVAVGSFPSLDNDGELLYITDSSGNIIHSFVYNINWYQNELKKSGGWTLEMIDCRNPCAGSSNWRASVDDRGGTPGKKNSVDAVNPDNEAPKLLRAYATDSMHIELVFNEGVGNTALTNSNYSIMEGIGIPLNAVVSATQRDRVQLDLIKPLEKDHIYRVTVEQITDCAGNSVSHTNTCRIGIAAAADSTDIVISEILFNPPANGYDYVELYNRSKKILNLQQLYIANRNSSGQIANIQQVIAEPFLLFPEDFIVFTENSSWLKNNFAIKNNNAFIDMQSLPSFSDDKGDVLLLNAQGNIVDQLAYKESWHFKLIDNKEGVALERISYNMPTQLESNWHSAASSSGYGTPGYQNSQFGVNENVQGEITISPAIVSPDNDGRDDFATIDYHFPEAGYVASLTLFDASGRMVRVVERNALCGRKGNFRWDGLGENGRKLSSGIYIMLTEVFNLAGKKKQFKQVVVIAGMN